MARKSAVSRRKHRKKTGLSLKWPISRTNRRNKADLRWKQQICAGKTDLLRKETRDFQHKLQLGFAGHEFAGADGQEGDGEEEADRVCEPDALDAHAAWETENVAGWDSDHEVGDERYPHDGLHV